MAAHIPDQFKPENVVAIHLSSDFGRAAKELYIGALFAEYENLEAVHAGGIEYRQKELLYSHAEVSEIAERLQTENRADILAELDMDDEKLTALLKGQAATDDALKQMEADNAALQAERKRLIAGLDQKNVHDLTISGKAESAGIQGTSAEAGVNARDAIEKRRAEDAKNRMDLLQYLSLLDREIAAIDSRIVEIDTRLGEIETELEELDRLDDLIKTDKIDPSNPHHAKLMKKHGITDEDLNSPDAAIIVAQRKNELKDERGALKAERGDLVVRRGDLAVQRERASQVQNEFESGALSEERVSEKISEMAEAFDGREDLATISYQTVDAGVQKQAAEAVAFDARAERTTSDAINLKKDGFDGFSESFDFDTPPNGVISAAREIDGFEISAPDIQAEFARSASAETPTTAPSVEQNIDFEINNIAL